MIDFSSARIALDTLFAVPDSKGGLSLPEGRFFVLISGLLNRASGAEADCPRPAECADYLNALELEFGSENAGRILLEECFEAIIKHKILPEQLSSQDETVLFLLKSVLELCAALKETVKFAAEKERKKLLPSAGKLFAELPSIEENNPLEKLRRPCWTVTVSAVSGCSVGWAENWFPLNCSPPRKRSPFSDFTVCGQFFRITSRILHWAERIFRFWFTACPDTARPV